MKQVLYGVGCLTVALLLCVSRTAAAAQPAYTWLEEECPPAFTVTGVVKLPAQASSTAKAKVVLNYVDQNDHTVIAFIGNELKALDVVHGKVRSLWPARKLKAGGACSFVIKRREHSLTLTVNGDLVGRAEEEIPAGGKLGTSATGGIQLDAVRFQEVAPVYFTDDFMRTADEAGEWEPVSGEWTVKTIDSVEPDPARSANPFSYHVTAKERAIAVTGYPFWDDYLCRFAVKPQASGAVGLIVFYQDPANYVLFRWWSSDSFHTDRARQLVWVRDGKEEIKAVAPGGYQAGQWYRLTLKATDLRVEAFIDGEPTVAAAAPPFGEGRIGVYAEQCDSASFDDAFCRHWESTADDPSPSCDAPKIVRQFSKEDTMSNWAKPEADWETGADGWRWNRGEFWGDASLDVTLPRPERAATASLVIHAESAAPATGYALGLATGADATSLTCTLNRQGKEIARQQVPVGEWPVDVEVWRHNGQVMASVGGEQVIAAPDPHPLPGTHTGFSADGFDVPLDALRAMSTHMIDDTFVTAPVNWWTGKGTWQVTSRWSCQPGWNWMAGTKTSLPILWSKRAIGGDFTVEAFLADKMDLPPGIGYSHPGNLNVTVCGDGRALDSGYSFIYAGWNNTASGIFRQDELVAHNDRAFVVNPISSNFAFHRHWFCARIERRGNHLRYLVDGQVVGEYDDPRPLTGGRIALWTIANDYGTGGLMVARVRAWYEKELPAAAFPEMRFPGPESLPSDHPLDPVADGVRSVKQDFETGLGNWSGFNRRDGALVSLDSTTAASGKQSLKIESAGAGGDLTVWSGVGPFDALKLGRLRFAYKVPARVKVNLYLEVSGRYYALEFTGGPQPPNTCDTLGKIDNVQTDDQWHTAEFDIGAALHKLRPDDSAVKVRQICFSAPLNTYYRAGISGNGWGAAWHLDDFELTAAQ